MEFRLAEKFLSAPRLAPYKAASQGNEQKALQLYLDNLRAGQSFHTSLSLLEVTLRNVLHDELASEFRSDNWLLEQRAGFMKDPRLTYYDNKRGKDIINDKALKMVDVAIKEYRESRNGEPTHGTALIADLSFGFWTTLFSNKYFFILNRAPLRAFAHRPRGTERKVISDKLTNVRRFRNRVYHHEPLCFDKQVASGLCLSQLERMHNDITGLLSWLHPDLPVWLAEADRVPDTLQKLRKKHPAAA